MQITLQQRADSCKGRIKKGNKKKRKERRK